MHFGYPMFKSIIYQIIGFRKNINQELFKTTRIKLIRNYYCLLLINQWCILCSPSNARLSNETYNKNLFIEEDDNLSGKAIFEAKINGQNIQNFDFGMYSGQIGNQSLFTAETNLSPSRINVKDYNFFNLSSKINEILNTTIPNIFNACRKMKDLHAKIYEEIIDMKGKVKTVTFLKIIEEIIKEKQEVYLDFEEKIDKLRLNAEKLSLIYNKATLVYQKIKTSLDYANNDVIAEHSDFITLKMFDEEERLFRNLIIVKNTFDEDKKQAVTIFKILSKLLILNPAEFKNDKDVEKLILSL